MRDQGEKNCDSEREAGTDGSIDSARGSDGGTLDQGYLDMAHQISMDISKTFPSLKLFQVSMNIFPICFYGFVFSAPLFLSSSDRIVC